MIDINTALGNWPFLRFSQTTPAKLSKHLKQEGISQALVSSIDAIFYPDPDVYNQLLAVSLKSFPELLPVFIVNPILSNWERIVDSSKVKAVKIYPGYHNYSLLSNPVYSLADKLIENGMSLMIQMRVEDERSHHPLCQIPAVPVADIVKLAGKYPSLPVVCLCPYFAELVPLTSNTENVYVDISFVETMNTMTRVLRDVPAEKILFGSHTPFLYTRAATMKTEYAEIDKKTLTLITETNAKKVFKLK
ncbi:MAG: amidohydrolase family protein [Victivallaceae bacterium]|jgi:predicted TIM-barrel fold metal-dependent hydrolase